MKKHLGNLISWVAFMINILFILLIINDKLNFNFIGFSICFAAFLDMFDGKVARLFVTDSKDFLFGEITDSLCDTINFGVVPLFAFFYVFKGYILLSLFMGCFYLWAVVFRLARFSKTKNTLIVKYYQGIPVTIAGPISVLITLIFKSNVSLVFVLQILLGLTMVSNIKIKKI